MKVKILLANLLIFSIFGQTFSQTRANVGTVLPVSVNKSLPNNNTQVLPIRRVILYSNGVAYIERRGIINGDAEINLSFKQSQVDDVLKSMVVLDLNQGRIGAVSYNSSAPTGAKMAEIPFSVDAQSGQATGIAGVLSQLQGAKVAVTSSKFSASGSILTVEKRQTIYETNKPPINKTFLVIASETGEISTFDLDEVRSIKLLDEGTQRDINEFANATASARRRDAKTITVTSTGKGQREMVVSYTIAAPIWKTTYRVVLDKDGKPFFQGWAIVDNVSDEVWENIELSLVSGSPVSFVQPLQKPFYRYRPVVPVPQDLQLSPQVYEPQSGVIETVNTRIESNISTSQVSNLPINGRSQTQLLQMQPGVTNNGKSGFQIDGASGAENVYQVDGQEVSNFRSGEINSSNNMILSKTTVSDALQNNRGGVTTAATGEEIGDLFEYKIEQPVTVLRDRSALIPIVQTKMDGERVAIYNQGIRQDRPFSGVLLKNLTNLTLESGSLTVIDGNAYAGEALMERLKPKEQRLISFALDLGTHVRVRQKYDRQPAKLVKVVNGVFQVHYFRSEEKLYQIENQTDRPKVLYIEYPIREGWILSENSPKPEYSTQRYYRFRLELQPFENKEMTISENQPLMDSYQLSSLTSNELALFITQRYINSSTQSKLERLIDLRNRIAQIETKIEALENEEDSISKDQKRLRENIEALAKTAEAKTLIARYVQKANDQESRLEQIEKDRKSLEAEQERLENELAGEIRTFNIEAE